MIDGKWLSNAVEVDTRQSVTVELNPTLTLLYTATWLHDTPIPRFLDAIYSFTFHDLTFGSSSTSPQRCQLFALSSLSKTKLRGNLTRFASRAHVGPWWKWLI